MHMVIGTLFIRHLEWLPREQIAYPSFFNLQRLPRSYSVQFSPSLVSVTHFLLLEVTHRIPVRQSEIRSGTPPHSLMLFSANTVHMSDKFTAM